MRGIAVHHGGLLPILKVDECLGLSLRIKPANAYQPDHIYLLCDVSSTTPPPFPAEHGAAVIPLPLPLTPLSPSLLLMFLSQESVELLFSRSVVKALVATETFGQWRAEPT